MLDLFYHLYVPVNQKGFAWNLIFDEQMRLIEESKLHNICRINVVLVAPRYSIVNGYRVHSSGHPLNYIDWTEQIIEYLETTYDYVKVISIVDSENPVNLYEGVTLQELHKHSLSNPGSKTLYIHTKGISHATPNLSIDNWRNMLNYFLISEWTKCVEALETHDVVAVKDIPVERSKEKIVSGNFFWANTDYISKLPPPLSSELYCKDEEHFPGRNLYRFAFEYWLMSQSPKTFWIHDSKTENYHTYYPKKLYIK